MFKCQWLQYHLSQLFPNWGLLWFEIWLVSLRGPCVKGLFPNVALLRSEEPSGSRPKWEVLKGLCDISFCLLLFSYWLTGREVYSTTCSSYWELPSPETGNNGATWSQTVRTSRAQAQVTLLYIHKLIAWDISLLWQKTDSDRFCGIFFDKKMRFCGHTRSETAREVFFSCKSIAYINIFTKVRRNPLGRIH
jgi:hypothetical protein